MVLCKSDIKILLVKTCEGKEKIAYYYIVNAIYPIIICIEKYLVPSTIWDIKK